jgi:hypothetical protein
MNWFGIIISHERELHMQWVEDDLLSLPLVMTLGTRRIAVRFSWSHRSPKAREATMSSVSQF